MQIQIKILILTSLIFGKCNHIFSHHHKSEDAKQLKSTSKREENHHHHHHSLPKGPLLIAYASWGQCDDKMYKTATQGANVLIWFSIDFVKDENDLIQIGRGPDNISCVAKIAQKLKLEGYKTTHLIAIGGWNAPHIDEQYTAKECWEAFKNWNNNIVANQEMSFSGFDGIDWDLEGHDNPFAPTSTFTLNQLNLMGKISQHAKSEGYIVTLAPAQSYLDCDTSIFNRQVNLSPEWKHDFPYSGRNTYAYLLAKYDSTVIEIDTIYVTGTNRREEIDKMIKKDTGIEVEIEVKEKKRKTMMREGKLKKKVLERVQTFDLVSVQLYEGYSRANYMILQQGVSASSYLQTFVRKMINGWDVDFSTDTELNMPRQKIYVSPSQLIIGLANGWASSKKNAKFLLIHPTDLEDAYNALNETGEEPRGFMFWNVKDEGFAIEINSIDHSIEKNDDQFQSLLRQPLFLAKEINRFLGIRKERENEELDLKIQAIRSVREDDVRKDEL